MTDRLLGYQWYISETPMIYKWDAKRYISEIPKGIQMGYQKVYKWSTKRYVMGVQQTSNTDLLMAKYKHLTTHEEQK